MNTSMPTHPPLFVVGTGRCGSTMLSELVREHPQLASLSEVFSLITDLGGRIAECFPAGLVDAAAMWRILGDAPPKLAAMLRHDVAMDEVLFVPSASSRHSVASGVPALLQAALPHLSDAPEAVFDELERFVATLPPAPVGEQYRRVFGWLARRHGRAHWLERSGGSLRIVQRLHAAFPDARFVHLVRDGRNCAVSMSRHLGFRMALIAMQLTEILGVDPWESPDREHENDLPDELVPFLPEHFDRAAFLAYETPLPLCGHYWAGEVMEGLRDLALLAPTQVLTLRYEDFGSSPRTTMQRLFEFLDVDVDAAWLDRMSTRIRPARSNWSSLPSRDRGALEDACRPGFVALGRLYEDIA